MVIIGELVCAFIACCLKNLVRSIDADAIRTKETAARCNSAEGKRGTVAMNVMVSTGRGASGSNATKTKAHSHDERSARRERPPASIRQRAHAWVRNHSSLDQRNFAASTWLDSDRSVRPRTETPSTYSLVNGVPELSRSDFVTLQRPFASPGL